MERQSTQPPVPPVPPSRREGHVHAVSERRARGLSLAVLLDEERHLCGAPSPRARSCSSSWRRRSTSARRACHAGMCFIASIWAQRSVFRSSHYRRCASACSSTARYSPANSSFCSSM
jgi:hypothetical protein